MVGQSVVAEAGFHQEHAATRLDRMRDTYDFNVLELHCHADPDLVLQRCLGRKGTSDRHQGHGLGISQEAMTDDWRRQYDWYSPLTDSDKLIRIDKTEFAKLEYERLINTVEPTLSQV